MSNRQRRLIAILLGLMLVLAAGAWLWTSRTAQRPADATDAAIAVPSGEIDPANDGRRIDGSLTAVAASASCEPSSCVQKRRRRGAQVR